MSSKAKIATFVVGAILAVGGGLYAFMPNEQDDSSATVKMAGPAATLEKPAAEGQQQTPPDQTSSNTGSADKDSGQPAAKVQDALPAPKKLTREQLTPPPLSESEKLDKAAQQESNF